MTFSPHTYEPRADASTPAAAPAASTAPQTPPTLEGMAVGSFRFHAVDRPMYPDRPWQLVGPDGRYLGPVNWSEDDARTFAAALSRLSGPAADDAGLVDYRPAPYASGYPSPMNCDLDALDAALSARPATAAGEPTPAVGGAALPDHLRSLYADSYALSPWERRTPTDEFDTAAMAWVHQLARLADPQARPAAPEGGHLTPTETDDELLNDFAAALTADHPGRNDLRDARAAVLRKMKGER